MAPKSDTQSNTYRFDGNGVATDATATKGIAGLSKVDKVPPLFPSWRLVLAIMQFTGCICIYLMRANLSVAIVCMTTDAENTSSSDVIEIAADNGNATGPYKKDSGVALKSSGVEEFQWDRQLRGLLLASFFIGYVLTQVPVGWATNKVGGKWLLFAGLSMMAIATFLSPVAARYSPYMLMAMQIIKGLGCGAFYPCIHHLLGRWAPPNDRSKLSALSCSGALIGTVLGFAMSGVLCDSGFMGGWPSLFYVYGLISVVWLMLWAVLVYDSPDKHPWISPEERKYIESEVGGHQEGKEPRTPWRGVLTSMPFYAICVADIGYTWGWYTVMTSLPQYMKDVLHFDIAANGFLSSLPCIASWLAAMVAAAIADELLRRKTFKLMTVRKGALIVGLLLPTPFLIGVGFLNQSHAILSVCLLTLLVALMGSSHSAFSPNMLDIAARFMGIMVGISNTTSNLVGFLAPIVNGALTTHGRRSEWQLVFILTALVYVVTVVFYTVFARGEVQPWAQPQESSQASTKEEIGLKNDVPC